MYVIDRKKEQVAKMNGKTLAQFLNAVMQHEIGDFCFASTEQEAGNILFSLIKEKQNGKTQNYSTTQN